MTGTQPKSLARHLGRLVRGRRNMTLTCPCCRQRRKDLKRFGNAKCRTPARYRHAVRP